MPSNKPDGPPPTTETLSELDLFGEATSLRESTSTHYALVR